MEPWFRILEHSYNHFTLYKKELLKLHYLVVYLLSLAARTNRTFFIHKGVIALIDLSSPFPSTVEAIYLGWDSLRAVASLFTASIDRNLVFEYDSFTSDLDGRCKVSHLASLIEVHHIAAIPLRSSRCLAYFGRVANS